MPDDSTTAGRRKSKHSPEGGISLRPYAAVRRWLSRVEALPRFEPMARSPLPPEISLDGPAQATVDEQ